MGRLATIWSGRGWPRHGGDPVIVGSVALGLVVRPDIDLEIYTDTPAVRDGFTVVAALAELPRLRAIRYKDDRDTRGQGLYWKLEYELTPDQTWTVDMWLFARDRSSPTGGLMTDAIGAVLTDDSRDTILAIKEEASALGTRAHGHWLYQAVLEEGIQSYAEYLAWIGDQDVWERTTWQPTPRQVTQDRPRPPR